MKWCRSFFFYVSYVEWKLFSVLTLQVLCIRKDCLSMKIDPQSCRRCFRKVFCIIDLFPNYSEFFWAKRVREPTAHSCPSPSGGNLKRSNKASKSLSPRPGPQCNCGESNATICIRLAIESIIRPYVCQSFELYLYLSIRSPSIQTSVCPTSSVLFPSHRLSICPVIHPSLRLSQTSWKMTSSPQFCEDCWLQTV